MAIKLFIDNNVWDILIEEHVDLSKELPCNEFSLYLTREALFEITLMPENKLRYVKNAIVNAAIKTDVYFGFYNENHSATEQRASGFGDKFNSSVNGGRFIEKSEAVIIEKEKHLIGGEKKKSGLFRNEADVSLAARAAHSAVLTCDKKKALKRAQDNSGNVIDLKRWDKAIKLSDFIRSELAAKIAL